MQVHVIFDTWWTDVLFPSATIGNQPQPTELAPQLPEVIPDPVSAHADCGTTGTSPSTLSGPLLTSASKSGFVDP